MRKKYKEAIQSCEPEILISIIKSMYYRMRKRGSQGKKDTVIDERYFKIAENNLYEELAFALGKNKNEMQKLIIDKIKKKICPHPTVNDLVNEWQNDSIKGAGIRFLRL